MTPFLRNAGTWFVVRFMPTAWVQLCAWCRCHIRRSIRVRVSHGICQDCARDHLGQFVEDYREAVDREVPDGWLLALIALLFFCAGWVCCAMYWGSSV